MCGDYSALANAIRNHAFAAQRQWAVSTLIGALDRMLTETTAEEWLSQVRWLASLDAIVIPGLISGHQRNHCHLSTNSGGGALQCFSLCIREKKRMRHRAGPPPDARIRFSQPFSAG